MRNYLVSDSSWYWIHPIAFFEDAYKEVKSFIQRGLRGYADCDYWSVDDYLNIVISGLIKKLREHVHGCPNEFVYDENLKKTQSVEDGCKDWEEILLVIEESFRLNWYLSNECYFSKHSDYKEGMSYIDFIKDDSEFIEYGMQLFILFYNSLWD